MIEMKKMIGQKTNSVKSQYQQEEKLQVICKDISQRLSQIEIRNNKSQHWK